MFVEIKSIRKKKEQEEEKKTVHFHHKVNNLDYLTWKVQKKKRRHRKTTDQFINNEIMQFHIEGFLLFFILHYITLLLLLYIETSTIAFLRWRHLITNSFKFGSTTIT